MPMLKWKENLDGIKKCHTSFTYDLRVKRKFPDNINHQKWETPLAVQLNLWRLAHAPRIPIAAKINLLFQIIEISFPDTKNKTDYPEYTESNQAPAPRTEARLLRDLASHGKKEMNSQQIQTYCEYLGIVKISHDPTDQNFIKTLGSKVTIVEEEARKIINKQITITES